MPADNQPIPIQGVGIGLRTEHLPYILTQQPNVPWFEIITENFLHQGERALYHLEKIRELYPLTFHGVSLSIGSTDPLNRDYLKALKKLIERFEPSWVSDHLCWSSANKRYVPDLLPMPYTDEAIKHTVDRIKQVQDYLGQRLLIENVSSYLSYKQSTMTEWDFVKIMIEEADCDLLLDINNIYVSAKNHKFDPLTYLKDLPKARIKEMHLAGFEDQGRYLLDTHSQPVHAPVWQLYEKAQSQFGAIPTLIEWDLNIPPFEMLLEESQKAIAIQQKVHHHAQSFTA